MKKLIWKLQCARHLRKLLGLSWRNAWENAGAIVEGLDGEDLRWMSPKIAAEEERDAWLASC